MQFSLSFNRRRDVHKVRLTRSVINYIEPNVCTFTIEHEQKLVELSVSMQPTATVTATNSKSCFRIPTEKVMIPKRVEQLSFDLAFIDRNNFSTLNISSYFLRSFDCLVNFLLPQIFRFEFYFVALHFASTELIIMKRTKEKVIEMK